MGGEEYLAMVRKSRRPYGSGCIVQEGRGLAIRWYESIIGADGKPAKVRKYEALGEVSLKNAAKILAGKTEARKPLL